MSKKHRVPKPLKAELRRILVEMGVSQSLARQLAPRLEPTMVRFIDHSKNREAT